MTPPTEGLAQSVHTRLIRHARKSHLHPNLVLVRYGVERFLYRLSRSPHSDRFVLKGALLLQIWLGETARATRDADLLGIGEWSDSFLLSVFKEICRHPVVDDGLVFDPESVRLSDIRETDPYGGRRVNLVGHLGAGRIPIQVDVGIGDAVEPGPEWIDYPPLLEFPSPRLRAYRPETVVAEKLQAMVRLGAANSRMKDFFDIYRLSEAYEFERDRLAEAIRATFARRGTAIPATLPTALTSAFATESKDEQWRAFLNKNEIEPAPGFSEVTAHLAEFFSPVLARARRDDGTPAR